MESTTADVFAFAMFAVEVFTGKIPFEGQKTEAVLLRISRGGRMGMPGNAQAVGLTTEMWKLLGSCWHQDPKKRPTMEEVVKRWRGFAENNNNDNVVPECVQAPLVIRAPSSVLCSTLYDRLRKSQPMVGSALGTSRFRAKSEVVQPPTRLKPTRLRTMSAPAQLRTSASAQPRVTPETTQLGRDAGALTRRRRKKPYYF